MPDHHASQWRDAVSQKTVKIVLRFCMHLYISMPPLVYSQAHSGELAPETLLVNSGQLP